MREIKFRIWDKNKKIMYMARTIGWAPQGLAPFICSLAGKPISEDEQNKIFHESGNTNYVNLYTSECELMQFTGLIDKNGKEVFEGDIVNDTRSEETLDVIEWGGQGFIMSEYDEVDDIFYCPTEWEVVGNIYENPGMLVPKSL